MKELSRFCVFSMETPDITPLLNRPVASVFFPGEALSWAVPFSLMEPLFHPGRLFFFVRKQPSLRSQTRPMDSSKDFKKFIPPRGRGGSPPIIR